MRWSIVWWIEILKKSPLQYLTTSTGLSLRYYHPRPGIRTS